MRERRRTLLVRICRGATAPGCGREYDCEWVEWTGERTVDSHGVCPECLERELTLVVATCEDPTLPSCGREIGRTVVPWTGAPRVDVEGVCVNCWAKYEIDLLRGAA